MAATKVCAFCRGKLGLIAHRHRSMRFCSIAHKKAYVRRQQDELAARAKLKNWQEYLTRREPAP